MASDFFVFTGRAFFSLEIQPFPFSYLSLSPPPVLIVDRASTICYPHVTLELTQLPDIEEAFKFVRSLVTATEGEPDLG